MHKSRIQQKECLYTIIRLRNDKEKHSVYNTINIHVTSSRIPPCHLFGKITVSPTLYGRRGGYLHENRFAEFYVNTGGLGLQFLKLAEIN